MFKSLQAIKSPLTRTVTSAFTVSSLVIMLGAIIIGLSSPKDSENKNGYKVLIYSYLVSLIGGGVVGAVTPYQPTKAKKSTSSQGVSAPQSKSDDTWKDWREFIVDRKVKESEEITSFYLKPVDEKKLPSFKPGQFLTIKLDIPEQPRAVIRTYSLSDYESTGAYYRLSIKRENAPKGLDVPPGIASNFIHDRINEGDTIPAKPPNGKFFLDLNNNLPAVLISNGVGITPMIAMAKACQQTQSERLLWFLHGARNGDYHACRQEIQDLAKDNEKLAVHYKYSRPRPEDEGLYDSQGYVDKSLLAEQILPQIEAKTGAKDAEYFLCGSPAFMDSIRQGLAELGVSDDRVFYESFSKGGKTKGSGEKTPAPKKVTTGESKEVTFARSNKTLTWTPEDGTLLDFAEANGVDAPSSCRQGICLTCMCELTDGEVEYVDDITNEPDEGNVLICICQPKTDRVTLNL